MYNVEIITAIKDHLINHKQTISVAESVSSGHLQAAFSIAKDASKFFQGGITAYNIGQKTKQLNVEPTCALECNCVSKSVAKEMAIGVADLFMSTYAISLTGYAAPEPEQNIEMPFTFYCIVKNKKVLDEGQINYTGNCYGYEAQKYYANEVLVKFLSVLNNEK